MCSFVIIVDYVSACICICIVVSWLYNNHISRGISLRPATFLHSIYFRTVSTSSVNSPSLISSLVLSVISEGFLSRFLKCSFHFLSHPSWLATFSFVFRVLFLLLTFFTVCYANLHYLLHNFRFY